MTKSDWGARADGVALPGEVTIPKLPGDKSIAHRVFMLAAMRTGRTFIGNVPQGADVAATMRSLEQLGASIERMGPTQCVVRGWGERGPHEPDSPLDCGNSATTARLIMGVVAPWDISVTITGDESLRRRPMERVTGPLSLMGARFDAAALPLTMRGTSRLKGISYELPLASAQVKSAVLLAGLRAEGRTSVYEAVPSRNHTELLLEGGWFGRQGDVHYAVPGDPSSAAFLAVAALLSHTCDVRMEGICLNPTRLGFLRVLRRMGADVSSVQTAQRYGEPVGTLRVHARARGRRLQAATVEAREVPQLIDEIPILSLVAAFAQGETVFHGVDELRVKECDRLKAIADGLASLGVGTSMVPGPSGTVMSIHGRPELLGQQGLHLPDGVVLDARNDHRLALTWLVARACSDTKPFVKDAESIDVSYPSFEDDLKRLRMKGAL